MAAQGPLEPFGVPIDLTNAGISALRGNYGDAALSASAAVPFIGLGANIAKVAERAVDVTNVVKEIPLSLSNYGEAATHAEDAIRAGYPDILTINRTGADANRAASIGGLNKIPGKQLDEYPPAMFSEGGAGASVRAIDPSNNMAAGACIGNACRGLQDGSLIKIKIVP